MEFGLETLFHGLADAGIAAIDEKTGQPTYVCKDHPWCYGG